MKDLAELIIIIDRSGSMHGLEKDVIGGFNSLIEDQKKEGETLVTTIFFNQDLKFVYEQVDINTIKPLDGRSYIPSGCTALLDAIGNAICFIKEKHSKLKEEELPAHTIFSIMTDGLENASKEFSYHKIKEMIEFQTKCGWDFIFQAANIDTIAEAGRLGIDRRMASSFECTSHGIYKSMNHCSKMMKKARMKKR